jgi:hypothetical protein
LATVILVLFLILLLFFLLILLLLLVLGFLRRLQHQQPALPSFGCQPFIHFALLRFVVARHDDLIRLGDRDRAAFRFAR